jgi:RES domain-containing protein
MSQKKATPNDPPEVLELFNVIAAQCPAASGLNAKIVRCVDIRFAKRNDFFSGEGAALFGGQWNRIGLRAIYASLDVLTATAEALQNYMISAFPKLRCGQR